MNLLEERCSKTMKNLEIVYNTNMPPQYYHKFFSKFPNLTRLNVYASMVDDVSFRTIGENCQKLIELNAGATWISNVGIKHICINDIIIPGECTLYR